jgi:hypothetical protein
LTISEDGISDEIFKNFGNRERNKSMRVIIYLCTESGCTKYG